MMRHHPIPNNTKQRVIRLDRGSYTTCSVVLKGASITSWMIENEEQIFLSRASYLDDYNKYRGGITLVFPHYDMWDFGRHHGFARDLMWNVKKGPLAQKTGDIYLELYLTSNAFTRSCWNYDYELRYSILLKPTQLEIRIAVVNPCPLYSFDFNFEVHAYLKVKNIAEVFFSGLKGTEVTNKIFPHTLQVFAGTPSFLFKQVEGGFKPQKGQTHTTYGDTAHELEIADREGKRLIKIKKINLPDFNLWNPWQTASTVDDLDEDEYKYFLTLDTGYILKKITIPPKSFWMASESFEIVKLDKESKANYTFSELFRNIC